MSVPRSHHDRPRRHLTAVGPGATSPPAAGTPVPPFEAMLAAAAPRPDLCSSLVPYVGDVAALLDLDTEPLPDDPFDWSGVESAERAAVAAVLALSDAACEALLDLEFRTIARRILALVASRDPRPIRRSKQPDRLAAGIVWLAGRGNGEFGRRSPRWRSAALLWDWFGVTSCADRGHSIRKAAGLVPQVVDGSSWYTDATPLGSVDLLHSRTRQMLIRQRDAILRVERERRRWSLSPDGRTIACRATSVVPLAVTRGTYAEAHETVVLVALGSPGAGLDDAALYGLSVPEARRLAQMLRSAIGPS